MASTKSQANIELSVSVSPKHLSLSDPEQEIGLSVRARTTSSSRPKSGITMNARWTALDGDNGIFKGAIFARSTPDESIHLGLAPLVKVSYSRDGRNEDLSKSASEHFVVTPALDSNDALTVTHKLTVERLFKFAQEVKPSDVKPGTLFRVHLAPHLLPAYWWSFEDETRGKKFYEGILPNEYGFGGMNSDDPEAVRKRESEGWRFSYPLEDLSFEIKDDRDGDTFTFVE